MPSSYTPQSLSDWLKPSRNEAITRLRTNGFAVVALFIVTHLAPIPSLVTAVRVVLTRADVGAIWWLFSVLETFVLAVLGMNILQASYALQYPPTSAPPLASASRPGTPRYNPQSPPGKTPRKLGITPVATPQPQKTFSASSSYAPSPISTPSRTLNYTIPASVGGSPFDTSLNTSSASLPGSPSPNPLSSSLAAYRGKHSSSIGRAFDGDLLNRLTRHDDDDDE
ncbi:hypothetical protein K474DRAFT_1683688 [Panus rudis PR-1116 ss-1]|nr:hypothetical protein K474DRAFT_1683688 [Panus rudis PR-1116 ss-1]